MPNNGESVSQSWVHKWGSNMSGTLPWRPSSSMPFFPPCSAQTQYGAARSIAPSTGGADGPWLIVLGPSGPTFNFRDPLHPVRYTLLSRPSKPPGLPLLSLFFRSRVLCLASAFEKVCQDHTYYTCNETYYCYHKSRVLLEPIRLWARRSYAFYATRCHITL